MGRVESNVVYGMYSGLALLMDIHYPEESNGYGIIHVSGSGWSAPISLDAKPLKESSHVEIEGKPLVDAGYTLFTVNHRATPRFQYPAAVDDVQRAVRFVRHHAKDYGIDPYRLGAMGGSSGGHLVSMLGVLDGKGDPDDESLINRESAKVQCVAARAAPSDFLHTYGQGASSWFLGVEIREDTEPESVEYKIAVEASPISHVSPDDPPFLLLHGDADTSVPISNTETFSEALRAAGVEVKVLRIPGAGHGPGVFRIKEHGVDYVAEIVEWFDRHLRI